MISFTELNIQNEKITELSKVLNLLIENRSVCDTGTTCDMFFKYLDSVKKHLDIEEKELYQTLLTHPDNKVKNTANQFLTGSAEIRKIFKNYKKRWCHHEHLRIKDHDAFVKDTRDMFQIVLDRIVDETEKFYPVVRDVYGDRIAA